MDITLSESCLEIAQNPLLLRLFGQDKSDNLSDDSQDGQSKKFESAFSLIVEELTDHKEKFLESMNEQLMSTLNAHYTSSGLQKEFPKQASAIINSHIEMLASEFDNSVLVLSKRYKPWLSQLIESGSPSLSVRHRMGDEDTSIIGLLAGFAVGAGVAGIGGAFLGGILGDLAGGLLGEPVDKLRKRMSRRVTKKVDQIESHIADMFNAQLPEIKQLLIHHSPYPWAVTAHPGAGSNMEIN